jgi:phosphodiesterase/alkaline phosphatase D-like protein
MLPVKDKKKDGMLSLYEDKPLLVNIADSSMQVYRKIHFNDHAKFNLLHSCYYNGSLYILERVSRSAKQSSIKVYAYKVK